jgi:hypothetical protein
MHHVQWRFVVLNSEIEKCWQEIEAEIEAGKLKEERARHNKRRRGQFQAGWRAASERVYNPRTLKKLHWNNLGYRFRNCLGPRGEDVVREAYEYLVTHHDGNSRSPLMESPRPTEPDPGTKIHADSSRFDTLSKAFSYFLKGGRKKVFPGHQNFQVRLKDYLSLRGVRRAVFEKGLIDVAFKWKGKPYIGEVGYPLRSRSYYQLCFDSS